MSGNLTLTAVVGSADFQAGNGTKQYPYLISTAGQFMAINSLSSQMEKGIGYNFALTGDIDLSDMQLTEDFIVTNFSGALDGNNHTIYANDTTDIYFIGYTRSDVTLQNITIEQNTHLFSLVYTANFRAPRGSVVFDHVTVNSESSTKAMIGNNMSSFVCFVGGNKGSSVTLRNCTNNADLELGIGGNYAGIFVGGYILGNAGDSEEISRTGRLEFDTCINNGTLAGPYVGFFTGNECDKPRINHITITNCQNNGKLIGTLGANWFAVNGGGTNQNTIAANSYAASNTNKGNGSITVLESNDLGLMLTVESANKLKPDATTDKDIATYEVSVYAQNTFTRHGGGKAGSSYVWLSNKVRKGDTSVLQKLNTIRIPKNDESVIWDDASKELYMDARYVIQGNEMIVHPDDLVDSFGNGAETVEMNSNPTYRVNAYDSNDILIGTAILNNNDLEKEENTGSPGENVSNSQESSQPNVSTDTSLTNSSTSAPSTATPSTTTEVDGGSEAITQAEDVPSNSPSSTDASTTVTSPPTTEDGNDGQQSSNTGNN